MLALAAARLGFKCHVYSPDAESPAFDVAAAKTVAPYGDEAALRDFARAIDVATYEFENIDVAAVELVSSAVPVRPAAKALAISQDRLTEKEFLRGIGVATAPYAAADDARALRSAIGEIGFPAMLKSRRFGYDGKGQALLSSDFDSAAALASLGVGGAILEGFVRFAREVSVIAVRALDGAIAACDRCL
jgi:5-(carboxyamino)imidazole ribonucleotide synthase